MSELGQEISKNVFDSFIEKISNDKKIKVLGNKIKNATDYEIANEYAVRVGELASQALQEETKGLAFISQEVAKEVLDPVLTADYEIVKEVGKQVQQNMNVANGLGIEALTPDLDTSRIQGLVDKVSSYATAEEGNWVLGEPIINYTQAVIDQTIHKNANANAKIGLRPTIVRKTEASGTKYRKIRRGNKTYSYSYQVPCEWCISVAGTYDYGDVSDTGNDVFRRHEQCRCTVTYIQGTKRQDVWNKAVWTKDDADARTEAIYKVLTERQAKEAQKEKSRQTRKNAVEQIMLETGYDAKSASILYNTYLKTIKGMSYEDGIAYIIDATRASNQFARRIGSRA